MECDDEDDEEEYILTACLDDNVWSEELILERDLCIHMAPWKSESSYTPQTTTYPEEPILEQMTAYPQEPIPKQTTTYPQEPIPKTVTLEDALSNLFSNMPDIIDNLNEALFHEILLEPWV